MTKKYIDFKEFKEIIYNLELDEETVLILEEIEDEAEYAFHFKHIQFLGKDIVLFDHPQSAAVGIIQDEYYLTFEESLEEIWETLTENDAKNNCLPIYKVNGSEYFFWDKFSKMFPDHPIVKEIKAKYKHAKHGNHKKKKSS